jgi:dihydrofolate synthase/folylpolyglutamate synthase
MSVIEALLARATKGMSFGLDATRNALRAIGEPQNAVPVVHVAGSNGKGSTAAMVESILRAAGLRTGLYTSPHLCRFSERIRVGGEPLDDARFDAAVGAVLERCPEGLTLFETLTIAAFHAFREEKVDVAIVEVGLGGRLDATNVVERPLATAITSIALEHTAILGDTLDAIAREKAGIARRGVPLVVGPMAPEAMRAIEETARAIGAGPLVRVVSDAASGGDVSATMDAAGRAVIRRGDGAAVVTPLGLAGAHQIDNAGVAVAIAWQLAERWPAVHDAVAFGLAGARWPGRLERVLVKAGSGEATVLLDAAHNPHGAATLVRALEDQPVPPERTTLVFGALADKAFVPMLEALAPLAKRRIYTAPKGRAAAPFDELARIAPGDVVPEPRDAVARAIAGASPGELVVVTGSAYLVGEVRGVLLGIDCDPVVAL